MLYLPLSLFTFFVGTKVIPAKNQQIRISCIFRVFFLLSPQELCYIVILKCFVKYKSYLYGPNLENCVTCRLNRCIVELEI